MTWVKLDDQFAFHPKLLEAGPEAGWLFVAGLCWCSQHLTDGMIPKSAVPTLAAVKRTNPKRLVDAGLWIDHGDRYEVHDYLEFQPSKAKVEAEREAARKRQEKFRQGRAGSNGVTPPVTSPSPTPDPCPTAERSSDDEPLYAPDGSSSWTDDQLYTEAGLVAARCFTGEFKSSFDDYASGAARAIRRERSHLVGRLRQDGYDLTTAATIIADKNAERIVTQRWADGLDPDFTPADALPVTGGPR